MERSKALELVSKSIRDAYKLYPENVQETDVLKDNLDSLHVIEVAINLERELNCKIPDETVEKWKTVKDIVDTVVKTDQP